MRRLASLAFLAMLAPTAGAQASRTVPPGVQPGARVRAAMGRETVIGRVLALDGDTLRVLRDHASDTVSLAAGRLTALDLSTGRHRRRWRGAATGFFAGALLGAIVGGATYKKQTCSAETWFCDFGGRELDVAAGAVIFAGAGTVVGAIVGAGRADSWKRVLPPEQATLRLLVPAGAGRVGLGASLRF